MKKKLSPRAKEIKFFMKQRLTKAEIGAILGITRQAVGQMMKKYGLTYPQLKVYKPVQGVYNTKDTSILK